MPLPLVPFEEYMLVDDRPGYPMNVFARMRFRGRLDRSAMESALRTAMGRHPLLRAVVRQTGRNRWEWIDAGPDPLPLRWIDAAASQLAPPVPGIDLRREPGVRVWVVERGQRTDFLYQAHHACTDGAAAIQFLLDLFRAYCLGSQAASGRDTFRPLEADKLRDRGRFGLSRADQWRIFRDHLRLLPRVVRAVRRRPVPLLPHEPHLSAALPPEGFPTTRTQILQTDEYAALRSVAARLGVSTNDILARDLFLALAEWQGRVWRGSSHHRVCESERCAEACWRRIWIPINLRTLAHRWMPAANLSSTVFLDRQDPDLADPQQLLLGIHRETQAIKDRRIGLLLIFAMRLLKALTGSVCLLAREDRCAATCVLSNLGSPLANAPTPKRDGRIALGDAVLEDVEMIAPVRPYTCANFCVFEYLGKLWVTLHYDPRPVTAAQAEDLLDTFLNCIRRSLEGAL